MITRDATSEANGMVNDEIHADLVETLFETSGSFMAGIFAGLLVPAIAWFATGDRIYLRLLIVMTCIAAYRIMSLSSTVEHPSRGAGETRSIGKSVTASAAWFS